MAPARTGLKDLPSTLPTRPRTCWGCAAHGRGQTRPIAFSAGPHPALLSLCAAGNTPLPGGHPAPQVTWPHLRLRRPPEPTFALLPNRCCNLLVLQRLLLLRRRLETMPRSAILLGCTPKPSSCLEPAFLGVRGCSHSSFHGLLPPSGRPVLPLVRLKVPEGHHGGQLEQVREGTEAGVWEEQAWVSPGGPCPHAGPQG